MGFSGNYGQYSKATPANDVEMIPLLDVNWQVLPANYTFSERDTDILSLL
jgi:DNA-binding transcriptional regulator YhcF (GntR family)